MVTPAPTPDEPIVFGGLKVQTADSCPPVGTPVVRVRDLSSALPGPQDLCPLWLGQPDVIASIAGGDWFRGELCPHDERHSWTLGTYLYARPDAL